MKMSLGSTISDWLEINHRSIRWLAARAKISDGYLGELTKDRYIPNPSFLRKLSLAMNVSYLDLMRLAGYIRDEDLVEKAVGMAGGGTIPPVVAKACSDPKMQKLIEKIWEAREADPVLDVRAYIDRMLDLPASKKMALLEMMAK